ncbi:hypothetical protein [Geobacillus kaustophilus]|uniref:hypothetical protein n=1 Tax=Geobacillus kaustophilus TaxID=1462 RepID=UPI0005CD21D3|nr:hypothetical protein [Geobacillus kaustophilus]
MNQLTIFDFVEDEKVDDKTLRRIQRVFPGWEVLGYMKDWEWGTSDDYAAIIRCDDVYKWVRVELYHDGRSRAGYTERTDFEQYWFDLYEKKGKHWVWRSLEDRERVFEIARQNMR